MSSRKISLFYAVLIALASMAVTAVITSKMDLTPVSSAQTVTVPSTNSAPLTGTIDATTFRNIAKVTAPAVVNIQTLGHARGRDLTEYFGGQGDDLLRRFFGNGGDDQAPQRGGRPGRGPQRNPAPEISGAGTGFIVDKAGFILTNNHVVEDADDIRVSLLGAARGESYEAKVIGRDVLTDCALIQMTEMPSEPLTEVRVSLDEGKSWMATEMDSSDGPYAWHHWQKRVQLPSGSHEAWVRAIDAWGRSQPINGLSTWNPGGWDWHGVDRVAFRVA